MEYIYYLCYHFIAQGQETYLRHLAYHSKQEESSNPLSESAINDDLRAVHFVSKTRELTAMCGVGGYLFELEILGKYNRR